MTRRTLAYIVVSSVALPLVTTSWSIIIPAAVIVGAILGVRQVRA